MNTMAVFLGGSILFTLGIVVIIVGIVVVNNILHKHWKPVKIFHPDSWKGFLPPEPANEKDKKDVADDLGIKTR